MKRRERFRRRLERLLKRTLRLRVHMGAILALTVAAGVAVNVSLHRVGVDGLPLRYAVASLTSYVVFLVLVGLWLVHLRHRAGGTGPAAWRRRRRKRLEDAADLLDAADLAGEIASGLPEGGRCVADALPSTSAPAGDSGGSLSLVPDVDESAVVLAVLAGALLLVTGSAAYLLWYAPAILAEAGVSVLVASMLARASRESRRSGWLRPVMRSTAGPFLLATVVLVAAGWALQAAVPDATRVVDVLAALRD